MQLSVSVSVCVSWNRDDLKYFGRASTVYSESVKYVTGAKGFNFEQPPPLGGFPKGLIFCPPIYVHS